MVPTPAAAWCTAPRSWQLQRAPGATRWRRRGAPASASPRSCEPRDAGGDAVYRRARSTACAASSRRPRRRIARRAGGARAAARAGAAAPGAGERRAAAAAIRRALGETAEPLSAPALLPAYVEIMLAVGDMEAARGALPRARRDRRAPRQRPAGRDGRAGARGGRPGRGRRPGRPRALRARVRGLAGARRAVRGGAGAGARGRWRAARSATTTRPGSSSRRRAASSRSSARCRTLAGVGSPRRTGARRRPRPDAARARGAAPGRRRQDQPGDRRGAVISERTVDRHVSNIFAKLASRRAPPRPRSPTSTSSLTPPWQKYPSARAAGWLIRPMRAPARRSVAPR